MVQPRPCAHTSLVRPIQSLAKFLSIDPAHHRRPYAQRPAGRRLLSAQPWISLFSSRFRCSCSQTSSFKVESPHIPLTTPTRGPPCAVLPRLALARLVEVWRMTNTDNTFGAAFAGFAASSLYVCHTPPSCTRSPILQLFTFAFARRC